MVLCVLAIVYWPYLKVDILFSLAKNYFFYPWQCGTLNLEDYDEKNKNWTFVDSVYGVSR